MQEGDVSGFMRGFASERKRMRERERERERARGKTFRESERKNF